MSTRDPLVRNISDTALLAAIYRARETERPDPFFAIRSRSASRASAAIRSRNPCLSASAQRGPGSHALMRATNSLSSGSASGVDMIVNLAAGLDARPYRMSLPTSLHWIEVDLPGILDYKEEILRGEKPACILDRVRLDLSDVAARRQLFAALGSNREERPNHHGRIADLLFPRRGGVSSAGPRDPYPPSITGSSILCRLAC